MCCQVSLRLCVNFAFYLRDKKDTISSMKEALGLPKLELLDLFCKPLWHRSVIRQRCARGEYLASASVRQISFVSISKLLNRF